MTTYIVTSTDGKVNTVTADYVTFDPTLIRFDENGGRGKPDILVAAFQANTVASVVRKG